MLPDEQILALAHAVEAALAAVAAAESAYTANICTYRARYQEEEDQLTALNDAKRRLEDARAALDRGIEQS